jgi:hypothetical protein
MADIWKQPGVEDLGQSPEHDDLFAGEHPSPSATEVVIAGGQGVLTRKTVLGRVTANAEFKLSASASADGSEKARAILAQDVDTTGGPKTALVYLTGVFNRNVLVFGEGHTAETVFWDLADVGIQLRDTVRP